MQVYKAAVTEHQEEHISRQRTEDGNKKGGKREES